MKRFTLSLAAVLAMGTFAVAGGDIAPVEPMVEVEAPAPASDSGFYIGGAYSYAKYSADFVGDGYDDGYYWDESGEYDEDYNALMIQAGYQINKYFAIEGRFWTSIGDGDRSVKGSRYYDYDGSYTFNESGSVEDGDFTAYGIYVKPMYPVTDALTLYGLLGYGNVTIGDVDGDWLDDNDFHWGAGASYALTENLSVFADYVHLASGTQEFYEEGDGWYEHYVNDYDVYTVNVGLTYKF